MRSSPCFLWVPYSCKAELLILILRGVSFGKNVLYQDNTFSEIKLDVSKFSVMLKNEPKELMEAVMVFWV